MPPTTKIVAARPSKEVSVDIVPAQDAKGRPTTAPLCLWTRCQLCKVLVGVAALISLSYEFGCAGSSDKSSDYPPYWAKLPQSGQNNVWYEKNSSDTVLVFVHGILSDSRKAWAYIDSKNRANSVYWPELIKNDGRLEQPSIFLGGYFTSVDAGPYDTRQAATELRDALKREGVLQKPNILFIAHSNGGNVTRFLLVRNQELFRRKRIGLILYACPSAGAALANRLKFLIDFYGNKLAAELQEDSTRLIDLDHDFRNLLYNPNSDPETIRIVGAEAVENFFVIHRWWLPDKRKVVPEDSASRYFGAPVYLRQTDHFSIVAPNDKNHPGHQFLVDFCDKYKKTFTVSLSPQPVGQVADLWKADSRLRLRLMPGIRDDVLNNLRIGPDAGPKEIVIRDWCSAKYAGRCVTCDPSEPTSDTFEVLVRLKKAARVEKSKMDGRWPVPQPGIKLEPWQLVNSRGDRFYYECKSE